jgi:hypothetical protein
MTAERAAGKFILQCGSLTNSANERGVQHLPVWQEARAELAAACRSIAERAAMR